jgi:serine/threonine protein kinase
MLDLNHAENQPITLDDKKFICIEKIDKGEGGGGYVYKIVEDIEETDSAKYYALKICKFKNRTLRNNRYKLDKKFKNEISIAKEFLTPEYRNNFITYLLDDTIMLKNKYGLNNHSCYVMDIADESFEDYLCYRLKWDQEVDILPKIKELAYTVKLLHSKDYVHRDIKPQNILVQGEVFKLADFGMVEKENTSCKKAGPKYWPTPELLNMCDEDAHCSGKQTDVFMLGCIFYFIYTKKYPVGNVDINLISDKFKMKYIIKKMISYDINERYSNCEEAYDEISKIRFGV